MSTLTNGLAQVNMVPNIGLRRPNTGKNFLKPSTDKYVLDQIKYPYEVGDNKDSLFSKRLFDEEFMFTAGKESAMDKTYAEFLEIASGKKDQKDRYTLSDLIDLHNAIEKYYKVKELLSKEKLTFNEEVVLNNRGMLDYIFCRKVFSSKPLKSAEAIVSSILDKSEDSIIREISTEIIRGAASQMIKDEKIETGTISRTVDSIIETLDGKTISFKDEVFSNKIKQLIKSSVYDADQLTIINSVKDELEIEDKDYPSLIDYLKKSNINITKDNAAQYLSIAMHHLKNDSISYGVQSTDTGADLDFGVTYFEDDAAANEIVKENILCAAQLYYVMTLMDELEIYNAVHHIITKYLPSGNVDVRDRNLLQDLQLYTFNEEFRDLSTGKTYKKTRSDERQMFYQQVFNYGSSAVVDGMITNQDFNYLWQSLLMASIEYLENSQESENQFFVSTQKVVQAVEDLQYNLSAHCTGMSKVAAPIINKELTFVVERILKHPEIATQINPMSSASFWKLIEKVVADMRGRVPNVSALRNKAVFGHQILLTIANYRHGDLEGQKMLDFIATIEAFIIANSQLESQDKERMNDGQDKEDLSDFEYMDGGDDSEDWDF